MAFVAVIEATKHKQLWSKAILSLAAISDHIKFVVSQSGINLSSVNSAKTSYAEISFKKSFFHVYTADFTTIGSEGYEYDEATSTYSFLINSKHLATLFRNLDAGDLDYICFKIYWSRNSPVAMRYKLLIEIKTRKLIIKKYQTNFQPVFRNSVEIARIYKQQLKDTTTGLDDPERINYIMIEQLIPKQFLDMIPASTEDFKIDIKNEKISFSGYTKQILKDREYLKQPMSVTITLNLDELTNCNLTNVDPGSEPLKKCVTFRLKDFKNFMNLISAFTFGTAASSAAEAVEATSEYVNLNDSENEDHFEIYFKNPGDPILFELHNNPHVQVQFIQVTSEDLTSYQAPPTSGSTNVKDVKLNSNPDLKLKAHILQRVDSERLEAQKNSLSKRLFSAPIPNAAKRQKTNQRVPSERPIMFDALRNTTPEPYFPSQTMPSSAEPEGVTYRNDDLSNLTGKHSALSKPVNAEDTDYSSSEEEKMEEEKGELEFGPTQLDNKPKSIFDI